jgi:hypothetical protein
MAANSTNPFGHPYPHAKLRNVKLTSITRLGKGTESYSRHLIQNDDMRNFSISRADEVAKVYGWRMPE